MELDSDLFVLTTVNAPRKNPVSGDELAAWLQGEGEPDPAALSAFFCECDLGAQLGFLRGRGIAVSSAIATMDRIVRPWYPTGYRFRLDSWKD